MMVSRRTVYEAHKKSLTDALGRRKTALVAKKLDDKAQKRDPQFRKLKADIKKYDLRIKALDKVEAVKADLAARKEIRLSTPKVKKEKKKAVVVAPKPKKERKAPPPA